MVHSILERVRPEDIRLQPYPYAAVREALPPDYYAHLAATFPSLGQVAGSGQLPNNKAYRLGTREVLANDSIDPAWQEFFAYHSSAEFFEEVRRLFGGLIERLYPNIAADFGKPFSQFSVESRQPGAHHREEDISDSDITLDTQFVMNSPVRKLSSVRGIHVDRGLKLFAATLYFRQPEDDAGGDIELYEFEDPRYRFDPSQPADYRFVEHTSYSKLEVVPDAWVRHVKTIPYEPNSLFFWLNTPHSLHGVSPRQITDRPRRYINFVGECYAGPEHGFFIVPPGNPAWRRAFNRNVRAVKRLFRGRAAKADTDRDDSARA